ncbi:MAG: hypothetical protein HC898_09885 [Phycisphaerales bacterium]|nr:hypothetical protein [Phycisphaerales bacterium]
MVHPVVKDDHGLLTMNAVLPRLQAGEQKQLVELAKLYRLIYDDTDDDPVRRCRDMIEAGCDFMLKPFPDMDHTFFTTSIELEKQVVRYVHDPELRQAHWQKQSAFVETHLTYKAGLGRLMQRIRHRLLSKPNQLRTVVHATGDHLQPMALTASTSFPEGTRSCV